MRNASLAALAALCVLTFGVAGLPVLAAADQTDPRLAPLFEQLKKAPDTETGQVIEQAIWHIWSKAQTAGGGLLLRQGEQYMNEGRNDLALGNFDALVQIEPEFAEAWNKRATLHYLMGNLNDSVADIQRVLALEERHFGALAGLGLIYDAMDRKEAALKAFRAALEIHPNLENIRRRAEELAEEIEGRKL